VLHLEFLGTLFLKALRMVIVPLIATSIVAGVAGIGEVGDLGRIGGKTMVYYLATSLVAVLTGLMLVNLIRPGVGAHLGLQEQPEELTRAVAEFGDSPAGAVRRILLSLVPANPFQAMVQGDVLPLIVFCLLFGACSNYVPSPHREQLAGLFTGAFATMMRVTQVVIRFAPLGIFALVAKTVATTGFGAFAGLAWYAMCVLAALAIHGLLTLPLILLVFARVNPLRHLAALAPALLTAFSTSSSSATLPFTMQALEERAGVSNRTTSFVVPLGATINMDGTALYECVAAMFIAQAYGVSLSFGQQVVVVLTAVLASIGAAGIPMAGLVMISVVLTAVGLPLEGVGLILTIDRALDMCRTTVNVWSDACGAAVIAHSEGERLKTRLGAGESLAP